MKIFLKGYYGYKNLGDEILLLGVLNFLEKKHTIEHIYIESGFPLWLNSRLSRHSQYLSTTLDKITCIAKNTKPKECNFTVFGGGEVITPGRKFPYNGWNYLLRYPATILWGRYSLLGGIGTPQSRQDRLLYNILLPRAEHVVTREKFSYEVTSQFTDKVELYHDFAEDILDQEKFGNATRDKLIINSNPYIRDQDTEQRILSLVEGNPGLQYWYMPADIGQDTEYYYKLKKSIPNLQYYDRTKNSITDITQFVSQAKVGVAARLHILFLLRYAHAEYIPLVYQEKISKFFG